MAEAILAPAGHYSPIPGPYSKTFCGGVVALEKMYGIDVTGVAGSDRSKIFKVEDRDGHIWHIRCLGDFLVTAFRDRTEDELAAYHDRNADRYFNSWFSSERLRFSLEIGARLQCIVDQLRPDHAQSRDMRRFFKRNLAALLSIQVDLMSRPGVTLAEMRTRLAPFGLPHKR